jgi:hypothetical protein
VLEARNLLSSGTFGLTPPVLVPELSPSLPAPAAGSPTVYVNSEVEPQVAVDPTNPMHIVGVWQQDRFRTVGGARAIVAAVSTDGGNSWSVAAIPAFNSTDPAGSTFARYTDPWVTITPTGVVFVSSLSFNPDGPVPGDTAVQVVKSTDGGYNWSTPTTLIRDTAPPLTDPADLANDKEMIVADPTDPLGNRVYVVWDRLNHPSDQQNFNAAHGVPFREDALFARTTDGGLTWNGGNSPVADAGYPASNLTSFQANQSAFGNQIVVEPDGTLVDVFTHSNGSGNQKAQADQSTVGVMRSTDHGATWSAVIDGPAMEVIGVTDPDTGAPVRDGDPLLDVAVDPNTRSLADPNGGNLYAVWADGRFSNFAHDDIAFSMSTDGGLTWSGPIKINQTTGLTDADKQAFTPSVAVNTDGTVAVTYYDFRNNTSTDVGATTDYWLVHASGNFTSPASWTKDEKRMTDSSFNIENAAPTSRGYFLGDYEGLVAAGTSFYAFFAQAGGSKSDPSNIWFRDPPPAPDSPEAATPSSAPSGSKFAVDALAALGIGLFGETTPSSGGTGTARTVERSSVVNQSPLAKDDPGSLVVPPAESADFGWSGGGGEALPEAISSDGGDGSSSE